MVQLAWLSFQYEDKEDAVDDLIEKNLVATVAKALYKTISGFDDSQMVELLTGDLTATHQKMTANSV